MKARSVWTLALAAILVTSVMTPARANHGNRTLNVFPETVDAALLIRAVKLWDTPRG